MQSDAGTLTKINTDIWQEKEAKSRDTIGKIDVALRTAAPLAKENIKIYINVSLKNNFGISKGTVTRGRSVMLENSYAIIVI
ncbi:TPA: hypothetical protein ROY17_005668 [Bacillus thuringiensis]|nr:hypothetical protein [Bacillus thuringiensis]